MVAQGLSLQDGIEKAGSPIELLWKSQARPWAVPGVKPEFSNWRSEQHAWASGTCLADLSHHMTDLFIQGPDAFRLLSETSANNYDNFVDGQAKQFVPVTAEGLMVSDAILMRENAEKYVLTGVYCAQNWVAYHAEKGGYDVSLELDLDTEFRGGSDPRLFRYQVQGEHALEVVASVFGGPLPKTKFFHSTPVSLAGREFRAFRHGMAGFPGYEFVGDYKDHQFVLDALLRAGEAVDMTRIGGLCYSTGSLASGWVPVPTPAIFTAPELEDYRRWLPLYSFEGQFPFYGSYYSDNIEDYYLSPYELGYGRLVSFEHDFIGRDALQRRAELPHREKVTVVLNPDDVRAMLGATPDYYLKNSHERIEVDGELVGKTFLGGYVDPYGTIIALGMVDPKYAVPGTEVMVAWGEHPGPGHPVDAHQSIPRLRATIQPVPFNDFARNQYRKG